MVETPSIRRRLICNLYECLLLLAFLFVAAIPFVVLAQGLDPALMHRLLQVYALFMIGVYFVTFWGKGQTLAMKTWHFRIESSRQGRRLTRPQLWLRYVCSCMNLALLGAGWWYALYSADRQFLQDRLAGTRLVMD